MSKIVRQPTDDPVVLRIEDQLRLQRKTAKSLIEYLGLANGTFTSWKYRNMKTYTKHIDKIAEYLEVSKEYLLEGIDPVLSADKLTSTDLKLLKMFHEMGNEQQKWFMRSGEFMVQLTKYERDNDKNKE